MNSLFFCYIRIKRCFAILLGGSRAGCGALWVCHPTGMWRAWGAVPVLPSPLLWEGWVCRVMVLPPLQCHCSELLQRVGHSHSQGGWRDPVLGEKDSWLRLLWGVGRERMERDEGVGAQERWKNSVMGTGADAIQEWARRALCVPYSNRAPLKIQK